jgi:glc operon protein GlcG
MFEHDSIALSLPMRTTQIIDFADARRVVDAIVDRIAGKSNAAVIAVVDPHGEPIMFVRMDGAPISSIRIAMNKAWTAARERKPTKDIGERARHPEKGFDIAYFGDPRFVGWGGGVPVWRNGEVVGAIAVSGLPQEEDIALATFGAELLAGSKEEK